MQVYTVCGTTLLWTMHRSYNEHKEEAHGPSCSPTHQVNSFKTCMKLVTGEGLVAVIVINMEHTLDHDAFISP